MSLYNEIKGAFPELLSRFEHAAAGGRLGHSFLVEAASPALRNKFALALAMLGACPEKDGGVPCGECRVCRQIEQGNSPDIEILRPQGRAYMIKVGEIGKNEPNTMRAFEDSFYLTKTSSALCKVGIIYDAERMNKSSQNAFLKTLEEPPPETMLILTTGSPAALLPTTRSRCQQITLPESKFEYSFPRSEKLYEVLGEIAAAPSLDVNEAETAAEKLIAQLGELRHEAEEKIAERRAAELARAKAEAPETLKALEESAEDEAVGEYICIRREFLSALHCFFAQLYYLASGAGEEALGNPEMFEASDRGKLAALTAERCEAMLEKAEDLLHNLAYNINDELALRTFVFGIASVMEKEKN